MATDWRDELIAAQGRRIAQLEAALEKALSQIAELDRKLAQNSSNSNRPPFEGHVGAAAQPWPQPGHKPQRREMLPPEKPSI